MSLGKLSNVPELPPHSLFPRSEELQPLKEKVLAQTNQRVVVTGKVVAQDHKYNGELVLIELKFLNETENHTNRQVCIVLTITFGQVDEIIINGDQEGFIRFGVKHGKLRLNLENGDMPLSNRNSCNEWHDNWWVTTTGESTAPIWEIEANGNPLILRGLHSNQKLGMIDLFNDWCVLKAVFKVTINSNDIEITAQDGAWNNNSNKKKKETMIRGFFRNVLEPKIKDYVSKVVLTYGSTVIS